MNKPEWNEDYECPQQVIDEIDEALFGMVKEGLLDMGMDEKGLTFTLTTKGKEYAEGM